MSNSAPSLPVVPHRTLFLASTPLHTFWSLGLACGPFAGSDCVLALIDQREGDRDMLAEAIEASSGSPLTRVKRFPEIGARPHRNPARARQVLDAVDALSREVGPSRILVGNDRRLEFYAALRAAPQAVSAYIEDGLFSYMPAKPAKAGIVARWWLGRKQRKQDLSYGVSTERPRMIGGSKAVSEGWVLHPEHVHQGLARKKLHRIEAAWYDSPAVRQICTDALHLVSFDPAVLAKVRLLLVLPHPLLLQKNPELRRRFERLAQSYLGRGARVAIKCHPRTAAGLPLDLPEEGCIELPRRLPVEVMAPLLSNVLVVGTLTTALISLSSIGRRIEVRSLTADSECRDSASAVYEALRIRPLDLCL